jgi:hypothetical protein
LSRSWLVVVLMLMAGMCMAQMPPMDSQADGADSQAGMQNPQSAMSATRTEIGAECGIRDTSAQSSVGFTRSDAGEWSAMEAGTNPATMENGVARVWRESNWLVDLHDTLGSGMATFHSAQMCFDAQGRIRRTDDDYFDLVTCGCMRFTALTFGTDGRVMRRTQRFVNVRTGAEIPAPGLAGEFPAVWDFRRLEQLPFYSLVKK